jgi:hypothetical protein
MNRFIWLIRREIWEHKAIWIAPSVVIACLVWSHRQRPPRADYEWTAMPPSAFPA